ncbi:MAG: hypothetical protein Q7T16_02605 [Candidatus Burarchaeum sp.]|nr:hypothetical protein [Candidatus Burarchaeum sp.]MDO8339524.1 hypothetical protein [Candidatus Burarchaeum sp.]
MGENMRFHRFYERALGSKVKVKLLLRLLNEEMSASEREVAEMMGLSHTAVSKAMHEFHELNLVTPVHVGNALLWRVNKESYLYKALVPILVKEPLEKLVELLAGRLGGYRELQKVVLFGPVAEGREERDSAIEVLLVLRPHTRYEGYFRSSLDRSLLELDKECRALFGNGLAAHIASEEELGSKYRGAVEKGISVIG